MTVHFLSAKSLNIQDLCGLLTRLLNITLHLLANQLDTLGDLT